LFLVSIPFFYWLTFYFFKFFVVFFCPPPNITEASAQTPLGDFLFETSGSKKSVCFTGLFFSYVDSRRLKSSLEVADALSSVIRASLSSLHFKKKTNERIQHTKTQKKKRTGEGIVSDVYASGFVFFFFSFLDQRNREVDGSNKFVNVGPRSSGFIGQVRNCKPHTHTQQ
jgi:hypothetical protein